MSYRDTIKKQIEELEKFIEQAQENKAELQKELTRLKMIEWEEDIAHDRNQQLLKG
jgi:prefoldin subunit 5